MGQLTSLHNKHFEAKKFKKTKRSKHAILVRFYMTLHYK